MTPLFLIDSSAWIFALSPRPIAEIRKRLMELVESNLAAITSPIHFELVSAEKSSAHSALLVDYLSALHVFPIFPDEWIEAADWAKNLRQKGHKIKTVDALIAFKAWKHRLTLVHADSDMDRIASAARIQVESYVRLVRTLRQDIGGTPK